MLCDINVHALHLSVIRDHWCLKNNLHWVLDCTFAEHIAKDGYGRICEESIEKNLYRISQGIASRWTVLAKRRHYRRLAKDYEIAVSSAENMIMRISLFVFLFGKKQGNTLIEDARQPIDLKISVCELSAIGVAWRMPQKNS